MQDPRTMHDKHIDNSIKFHAAEAARWYSEETKLRRDCHYATSERNKHETRLREVKEEKIRRERLKELGLSEAHAPQASTESQINSIHIDIKAVHGRIDAMGKEIQLGFDQLGIRVGALEKEVFKPKTGRGQGRARKR